MTGIRVNEDTYTLVLRDVSGHFYSFDKTKLKTIEPEPGKTVMPSYGNLSTDDMDNLVHTYRVQGSPMRAVKYLAMVMALCAALPTLAQVPYQRLMNSTPSRRTG